MNSRILYFIFCILSISVNAQSRLDSAIKILEEKYTQEKVYLLFDNENYTAGDNIWFKAFVFNGYKPTQISTNLFVELYDKDKNLLDRKIVPIAEGQSEGTITMKKDIAEGVYFIRSYTPYMTLFPEEFQYIKEVKIYNPNSKLKLVKNDTNKWHAEVIPEGHNFVENQTTKFAVRLKSDGDLPKNWEGFVFEKDNPSNQLVSFKNLDENVSSFHFRADSDKAYQLQIVDDKNNKQIIDLPKAEKSGLLFKVVKNNDDIALQLKGVNLPHQLLNYKIIGTINNQHVFDAKIVKEVASISNIIPKDILQAFNGVINFTVFNEDDEVVANRLLFINKDKLSTKPDIELDINKTPRSINSIKINNQDQVQLSSVIRTESDNDNLLSSLWLTNDFKSKISNPAQYFINNESDEALDALLISENWKRFNWNELLEGKSPTITDYYNHYLSYVGKTYLNGTELRNSSLSIVLKPQDSEKEFFVSETDSEGNVTLDNLFYYGPIGLNYFLNEKSQGSGKSLVFSMFPTFRNFNYRSELPSTNYLLKEIKSSDLPKDIKDQITTIDNAKRINKKTIQLKEVLVRSDSKAKTNKLNDELTTGRFRSLNEKIIDFVNEDQPVQAYSNIIDFLVGRVPGLTASKGQSGESIPMIRNSAAAVYVDEINVSPDNLTSINVNNIAMVKVFKGAGLLGNAIAIYTKRGSDRKPDPMDNLMSTTNYIQLQGYNKALPYFNLDDYEMFYSELDNDVRDVLYWNTSIDTDNDGATIEYYNNDKPKDYKLTVIGFKLDGTPIFYEGKIN